MGFVFPGIGAAQRLALELSKTETTDKKTLLADYIPTLEPRSTASGANNAIDVLPTHSLLDDKQ